MCLHYYNAFTNGFTNGFTNVFTGRAIASHTQFLDIILYTVRIEFLYKIIKFQCHFSEH